MLAENLDLNVDPSSRIREQDIHHPVSDFSSTPEKLLPDTELSETQQKFADMARHLTEAHLEEHQETVENIN